MHSNRNSRQNTPRGPGRPPFKQAPLSGCRGSWMQVHVPCGLQGSKRRTPAKQVQREPSPSVDPHPGTLRGRSPKTGSSASKLLQGLTGRPDQYWFSHHRSESPLNPIRLKTLLRTETEQPHGKVRLKAATVTWGHRMLANSDHQAPRPSGSGQKAPLGALKGLSWPSRSPDPEGGLRFAG